ncbi:hypothetical protein ACKI1I_18580 [Streptomyces turgidiscabies]|uniref:Uncharacterized protein n=1 Tax=Streptomyces turgidiscabies (strain Car8) TaxID=698760 RepID=L7ES10_STRT8|nr:MULTISPECIES: hypothetical protein [Streptomyces]ELP61669.1 hypothetical protein STRTUCAR8_06976 [Streptomyces turgidiscabies Car8]MDX3497877.1 hypothetical protein [Streptomyces turgidiscabies]GAQ69783.1 hypothetical protein T45_01514 [Streptomyces turgidiscabies]
MNGDDMSGSRPRGPLRLAGLLADALREHVRDDDNISGDAERRAIAAFLTARDSGAHKVTRTRRRDDWR